VCSNPPKSDGTPCSGGACAGGSCSALPDLGSAADGSPTSADASQPATADASTSPGSDAAQMDSSSPGVDGDLPDLVEPTKGMDPASVARGCGCHLAAAQRAP